MFALWEKEKSMKNSDRCWLLFWCPKHCLWLYYQLTVLFPGIQNNAKHEMRVAYSIAKSSFVRFQMDWLNKFTQSCGFCSEEFFTFESNRK